MAEGQDVEHTERELAMQVAELDAALEKLRWNSTCSLPAVELAEADLTGHDDIDEEVVLQRELHLLDKTLSSLSSTQRSPRRRRRRRRRPNTSSKRITSLNLNQRARSAIESAKRTHRVLQSCRTESVKELPSPPTGHDAKQRNDRMQRFPGKLELEEEDRMGSSSECAESDASPSDDDNWEETLFLCIDEADSVSERVSITLSICLRRTNVLAPEPFVEVGPNQLSQSATPGVGSDSDVPDTMAAPSFSSLHQDASKGHELLPVKDFEADEHEEEIAGAEAIEDSDLHRVHLKESAAANGPLQTDRPSPLQRPASTGDGAGEIAHHKKESSLDPTFAAAWEREQQLEGSRTAQCVATDKAEIRARTMSTSRASAQAQSDNVQHVASEKTKASTPTKQARRRKNGICGCFTG